MSESSDTSANTDSEQKPADALALGGWRDLCRPAPLVALAWALFQLLIFVWPDMDIMVRRAGHVAFATALTFLLMGRMTGFTPGRWFYRALACIALLPPIYIFIELDRIYDRIVQLDPVLIGDYVFACAMLGLLLVAALRRAGLGMFVLAVVFIAYQLFGGNMPGVLGHNMSGFSTFIDVLFLTERGIFGIPTAVSAEIVFYFILFAGIFDAYGGGQLIVDLAMRLTGRQVGGPAKASVIASGLTGSVSGSAVANVMSTGIFTIPLMRRVGYNSTFAAATESVASTGGQILPPVMGAGAFIMANFLQIPYQEVVLAALVPALLYFASLLFVVHYRARRDEISTLDADEVGDWRVALKARWHLLVPLIWLVVVIVSGLAVAEAAVQASILTVVIGTLRRGTRQRPLEIIQALVRTSERALSVALPCAVASVIVAVIAFTGLGTKFTSLIVAMSSGSLALALILSALGSLVLGAGMPTTSAYIMAAVLIAPALVNFGLDPTVAHLFVFYISIMSMVTPPVALAAYAASTISGSRPGPTGWWAFYLATPALAIPFAFTLHPELVTWSSASGLAWALLQVVTACWALAVAVPGWLGRSLHWAERGMFAGAGIACFLPLMWLSIAGFFVLAALVGVIRLGASSSGAAAGSASNERQRRGQSR